MKKYVLNLLRNQSSSLAINSVFFRKADVAVISEDEFNIVAELNPQLKRELKILSTSKPFLSTTICFTEKLINSPDLVLAKSMKYKVHDTQTGRDILKMYKMKKIIPFQEEYMVNVSELFNKYSALNKKTKTSSKARSKN